VAVRDSCGSPVPGATEETCVVAWRTRLPRWEAPGAEASEAPAVLLLAVTPPLLTGLTDRWTYDTIATKPITAQCGERGTTRTVNTRYLLRIPKPVTVRVCRQMPGRASVGDTAEARLEPGLLDLLASPIAGSALPLGAAILPETIICHSIAGTAAYLAIGDHEKRRTDFGWSGGDLELTWNRPARRAEVLIGRARVSELRGMTLRVAVETLSEMGDEVLASGLFGFVAIRDGRAVRLDDGMLLFDQPTQETASDMHVAAAPGTAVPVGPPSAGLLRRLWRRLRGRHS